MLSQQRRSGYQFLFRFVASVTANTVSASGQLGSITRLAVIVLGLLAYSIDCISQDLDEDPSRDLDSIDHSASTISADDIPLVKLLILPGKPELDGHLDDPFWLSAYSLSIDKELYPERFSVAKVKTDVRIGLTSTHLYVSFSAFDPSPEKIRSAVRQHDGVKEDDYVSLVVDPSGNLRRKYEFRVNPDGSRSDVLQNTVSDRYIYDWDTDWEAVGIRTNEGYQVEMAIPLNGVKSPAQERSDEASQTKKWLVMLKRSYPRQVDSTFGGIYLVQLEKSVIATQELSKTPTKNYDFRPHLLVDVNEERDASESFTEAEDHDQYRGGLDAKIDFSTTSSLSLTLNPSYTDVEADIARDSINNPFNVFQPEKRRFFQEDMELYSTLTPALYTRNIIQPEVGVRFSHESESASMGGFWVNDEETELIMPDNLGSDKVSIDQRSKSMALRYLGGNKGNAHGALMTARTGNDGYYNYMGGIDGLVNLGLDDKLRYQLLYSQTEYPESFADDLCEDDDCTSLPLPSPCLIGNCATTPYVLRANTDDKLDGHLLRLSYRHDSPKSLYWIKYNETHENFRADLGFVRRVDYRVLNAAYGRNWFFRALRNDNSKSRGRVYLVVQQAEAMSGERLEKGWDVWGEFRGSYQSILRVGHRIKERAVNRIDQSSLDLNDNAPLFDERYWQWYLETSPVNQWTFNFDGRYGELADSENIVLGDMKEYKPRLTYRLDNFELKLSHIHRDFVYNNERLYKERFSTLTLIHRPDDKRALRLMIKSDKTDRDTSRFVGDDPAWEKEKSMELTYYRKLSYKIELLTGVKFDLEDDSELNDQFTSNREFYIKLIWQFNGDALARN